MKQIIQRWLRARRLRSKLMLLVAISVGLSTAIIFSSLIAYDLFAFRKAAKVEQLNLLNVVGSNLIPAVLFGDERAIEEHLESLGKFPGTNRVLLLDASAQNKVFEWLASRGEWAEFQLGQISTSRAESHFEDGNLISSLPLQMDGEVFGILVTVNGLEHLQQRLSTYFLIAFLILVLASGVAYFSGRLLVKGITHPMDHLIEAMQRVKTQGDYITTVAVEREDEFGDLAENFNQMLSEINDKELRLSGKISELIQIKQDLEKAKKKAEEVGNARARFVATVSHEIRTPLNGILGCLNLLKDEQMTVSANELVKAASSSGEILHMLLNDVIDFARSDSGEIKCETQNFSPSDILDKTAAFWKPQLLAHGIALVTAKGPGVPDFVIGDEGRVRQILNNYISNAIKYANTSVLHLAVETIIDDGKNCSGTTLNFSVEDKGIGITQADQEQLFSEFSRVGPSKNTIGQGTGLGLAINRRLAKAMNGRVGLTSKQGRGSCFWLCAPFEIAVGQPAGQQKEQSDLIDFQELLGRRAKILLAEDVVTNQMVARRTIEGFGGRVTVVNNGVEAVDAVMSHQFDLVLMDIAMPEMDGLQATKRLVELKGKELLPPIIALTAHGLDEDLEVYEAAGMSGLVTKPFLREKLYDAIRCAIFNSESKEVLEPAPVLGVSNSKSLDTSKFEIGETIQALDAESKAIVIEQCLEDLLVCKSEIETAVSLNDCAILSGAIHKLKSLSGTFGLLALYERSAQAYSLSTSVENSKCIAESANLLDLLDASMHMLRAYQSRNSLHFSKGSPGMALH